MLCALRRFVSSAVGGVKADGPGAGVFPSPGLGASGFRFRCIFVLD